MIIDGFLLFTGTSNGASSGITAGANTDLPTTGTQAASNVIDLGVVLGIPDYAHGGGARDIGTGDKPALKLFATVVEAMVGGTSIQLQLEGAPDDGSGGQGSYTIMWTSPAILLANLDVGARLANIDVPLPVPNQVLPRFLRLEFISSGTFTDGEIEAAIVIDRMDQVQGLGSVLSAYPPGITIAN